MAFVSPEPNSGCWLWTAYVTASGYGKFGHHNAHRFSYQHFRGSADGMDVHHKCHVRCCVNPDHLEALPHVDNVLKPESRRRHIAHARSLDRSRCKRGHPMDEANTWVEKNGARHCRACRRKGARAA